MIITRRLPKKMMWSIALRASAFGASWALLVFLLYRFVGLQILRVPFLPIATIGTAVAFYVGFKNNSAYDRFWEGRKIWGGVVNSSRTWGNAVVNYVLPGDDSQEAQDLRQELVYRHLAWINAVRLQLRSKSRFFDNPHRTTKARLENHAEHMRNDWDKELSPFLSGAELAQTHDESNAATQLLVRQGGVLSKLLNDQRLDLFHQIALMEIIEELYTLQGKAERIKNTPFPRQYAEMSRVMTRVFVALVPLGLLDVWHEQIDSAVTLASYWPVVPMCISGGLITWVFMTMEGVGDASEDPFERSMNDVPMNALCRTIEIDLRQMLGETDLPPKEQPIDFLLY